MKTKLREVKGGHPFLQIQNPPIFNAYTIYIKQLRYHTQCQGRVSVRIRTPPSFYPNYNLKIQWVHRKQYFCKLLEGVFDWGTGKVALIGHSSTPGKRMYLDQENNRFIPEPVLKQVCSRNSIEISIEQYNTQSSSGESKWIPLINNAPLIQILDLIERSVVPFYKK